MKIIIELEEGYGINEILSQLPEFRSIKYEENLDIEVAYNSDDFLKGEIFAVIVAYVRWLKLLGKQVNVICDTSKDCNAVRYAARINFFKLLEIPFEEKFKRINPTGRFIEIKTFEEANQLKVLLDVVGIFKNTFKIDDTILDCINYCFGELVSNVDMHSQSGNGGIIYAQYFPKLNKLKFFIIDSGVGFHKSLTSTDNYKELTEEEALKMCVEKAVTNGKGKGMGLYDTSLFVAATKGILSINSCGKELWKTDTFETIKDVPYWQGSIISMELKTNVAVNYEEVFEGYTPAGYNDYEYPQDKEDNQIDDLW